MGEREKGRLRLIIVNDRTTKIIRSIRLRCGLTPHASPIISKPRLGKRNFSPRNNY